MLRKLAMAVALFGAAACSSADEANDNPDAGPDAGFIDTGLPINNPPDAGEPLDTGIADVEVVDAGPPPPDEVSLSGTVYTLQSYLSRDGNLQRVGNANLLAEGVNNLYAGAAFADPQGAYQVTLPANGLVNMRLSRQQYNVTYNEIVTAAQPNLQQNLYAARAAFVTDMAGPAGYNVGQLDSPFPCQTQYLAGQNCFYAVVIGRIFDDGTEDGTGALRPVEGISADDFTVTGPGNSPWYVRGPYFLNYDATPLPGQLTSVRQNNNGDYRGGLYVTFVEAPVGNNVTAIQLSIAYEYQLGQYRYFGPSTVLAGANPGSSVHFVDVRESLIPPPDPVLNGVDFPTQVYPLFLSVAEGGFGCVGCHTNQNDNVPSGNFNVYGGPDAAYTSLLDPLYPNRVITQNEGLIDDSYVLKRPLFEPNGIQDHPIFAFNSEQDPAYQLIRTWIAEGALPNNGNLQPVNFYQEVRPLLYETPPNGGAGCRACHVDGVDEDTAPGGLYLGGTCEDLHTALTAYNRGVDEVETYRINETYPERSLVLTNPLFGNAEPHPVKIFSDTADPRYQLIFRWIAEGAEGASCAEQGN